MSLAVWLPLNGDLHNQGLSDVTVTNNGATINTSGKIGSCYSFDGTDDYISLTSSVLYDVIKGGTMPFSIAMWVYHADATRGILFGDYNLSGAINFNIELTAGHALRFYWAGSPDKNFTITVDASQWTHICLVYDGTQILVYKNGIIQSDKYTGILATKTKTAGAYYLGRDSRTGTTTLNGRLNDFRIYDHALSAKEVEEIAKGLVLHYKLDQPNQNLLTKDWDLTTWNKESGISVSWDNTVGMYKVLDSSHMSSRWGIYQNITLTANTTYTFSVDGMKKDQNVNFGFAEGTSWPANAGSFTTIVSRLSKTITVGDADANCRIYLNINPVTDGSNYGYFRAPKLEIGAIATSWNSHTDNNTIYDSSGYGNNGTITGSLAAVSESSRYSIATQFANGQYIRVDNRPAAFLPKDAITVNLWQYSTSWSNPISCTEGGGWNFENSSGIRFPVYISGVGYKVAQSSITPASLNNAWHMLTGTMDKDNIKIYIDGEEAGTVTKGSINGIGYANNYLFISGEASGNSVTPANSNYTGKLSDVRIYATALTPEQIKELYNTSMSIDNKGNIHARELVEL